MIAYMCKYAPAEILRAMGAETLYLEPSAADSDMAGAMMHPMVCSFVKSALGAIMKADFEGVLLTSCCDSSRRLFDVLRARRPGRFAYMAELPAKAGGEARGIYVSSLKGLIDAYGAFSGKSFSAGALLAAARGGARPEAAAFAPVDGAVNLGLVGAKCGAGLVDTVRRCGGNVAFNLSCTGHAHSFGALAALEGGGRGASAQDTDAALDAYADGIFSQYPCMRMIAPGLREEGLAALEGQVSGLIYHTVKFCDSYAYEYAALKGRLGVPALKVETDYTAPGEGQELTRVAAFVEALGAKGAGGAGVAIGAGGLAGAGVAIGAGGLAGAGGAAPAGRAAARRGDFFMGIDSGSTSTNAVIVDADGETVSWSVVRTGPRTLESAARARDEALERAGLGASSLGGIVATGYGRINIGFADGAVTEISCHAAGAHRLNPAARTILDIGGQDSKAIRVDGDGAVADFAMNDKCAAGTGRFLEMMARTLDIGLEDMGEESLGWKEELRISSMCAVFAESEVVSLIAQNRERADILRALNMAIASRSEALLARAGGRPPYMMTGGVARNAGVVRALEDRLGAGFWVCERPETVGALGAALIAAGFPRKT
ncbi:MAG: acyl-CoA dehydratase activase [Clostridiales Family XIII bacterium]|jgi:predicted CoA-substrate-specific enzyme activase|nr:acyl-CoA dehydratase activase [Clostridiales Family XIII bacterium]